LAAGDKKGKAAGMLMHKCWFVAPGPKLDDIEEVACMDEHVRFFSVMSVPQIPRGLPGIFSGRRMRYASTGLGITAPGSL